MQIGHLAAPIGKIGEKALKRAHALGNALAVVEPIDADDHSTARQAAQHFAYEVRLDRPPRQARESFCLHPDREGADAYDAIAEVKAVAARPWQAALVGDVAGEIRRIDFGLETDQVVMAERWDQLIVIWQRREDFWRREWNVDEEPDLVVMPAIAQRLGERHEMIVVDPDDVVGPQQLFKMTGEILVDAYIAAEVATCEFGEIEPIMQNWPQHTVRKTVVEFLVVVLGQINSGVSDIVLRRDLDGLRHIFRNATAPAKPQSSVTLERRADRDFKSAGSRAAVGNADPV